MKRILSIYLFLVCSVQSFAIRHKGMDSFVRNKHHGLKPMFGDQNFKAWIIVIISVILIVILMKMLNNRKK